MGCLAKANSKMANGLEVTRGWGKRCREILFDGNSASVWNDKNILEGWGCSLVVEHLPSML